MNIDAARAEEHAKYERVYTLKRYAMGASRMQDAIGALKELPCRGDYLDVSAGRGEMLRNAAELGFDQVRGTEIVPALVDGERVVRAEVHKLPFASKTFDVVSMFDVIEHLVPGDDELACRELERVARHHVLITANNRNSFNPETGDDLHINKRPYREWDKLFREWFCGKVMWIGARSHVSECWRVDL